MSQNAVDTPWTLELLLGLFDVTPADADRFTADTGIAGDEGRVVVEGTQVLAQAIVAAAKRFPDKSIRSAQAVFARVVTVGPVVVFDVDVVQEGRSTATAVVTASQNGKRCVTVTVLADVPTADLITHHRPRADVVPPDSAFDGRMPLRGRDIRVVEVEDVNSPDEVGPPELHAWLRYDPVPDRADLAKALLAHFTGHLGISTTMRAHAGIGTSQAHVTVSTAPMTLAISFHEPVRWDGWILYSHESTQAGAGMSYVRGTVHTEDGALLASFAQDGLVRPLRASDSAVESTARL
ncbi:acyl-CoA thioesterase [Rhodococcus gannanensis]|uniref:Acyl-CoA thioesterase n=1 Tax=Rhodococcus gannanensis TaxID=1960308 RepID=A0ABW4P037_9NOCA